MTVSTAILAAALLAAAPVDSENAASPSTVTEPSIEATSVEAPPEEVDPFLQPVKDAGADFEAERLAERRSYLKFHQAAGLTALGLLAGQVALGQVLLNEGEQGFGEDYDQLQTAHLALGIGTFTVYSAAAIAQLLAPKIDEREGEFSTISVHKALALVHGTGMLITPILGWYMTEQREEGNFDQYDTLKTVHQTTGYVTLGALAGAALVITF